MRSPLPESALVRRAALTVLLVCVVSPSMSAWPALRMTAWAGDRRLLPPDGCVCPAGSSVTSGELIGYAGNPALPPVTFDRDRSAVSESVRFPPFGSDVCVPGDPLTSRVDFDVWQMQLCDVDMDHSLRVRATGEGRLQPYLSLFWSGGGADPFTGVACVNQIAAAASTGDPPISEADLALGAGPLLDGHIDIVVTPRSKEDGGRYDLIVEAGGCRRPELRLGDPDVAGIDDVCRGGVLSMRWTLWNDGDIDQPDNADGEALGGRELAVTLEPPWRFVSGGMDA